MKKNLLSKAIENAFSFVPSFTFEIEKKHRCYLTWQRQRQKQRGKNYLWFFEFIDWEQKFTDLFRSVLLSHEVFFQFSFSFLFCHGFRPTKLVIYKFARRCPLYMHSQLNDVETKGSSHSVSKQTKTTSAEKKYFRISFLSIAGNVTQYNKFESERTHAWFFALFLCLGCVSLVFSISYVCVYECDV